MIPSSLSSPFFVVLVVFATLVHGQAVTSVVGTWSSGAQHVVTGPGFANPANQSFTYPKTTGISYSFSEDGHYEIARYRYNGNGSEPNCITGVVNWVHGTYTLEPNGSIVMTPFGDGYQQIQDPCAAVSKFIEDYNDTELYQGWTIFQDPTTNANKLHLFQFDGAPLAPMFLVSDTPNMLPTQLLRNVTQSPTTGSTTLTNQNALAVTGGARIRWSPGPAVVTGLGAFVVGLVGLAL